MKIGFGGGCHWCTEAVFQSLIGVKKVYQGWIASIELSSEFSEAVLVIFDENIIDLASLIEIHLNTHSSTSNHSMRKKYRSAIYTYHKEQKDNANEILKQLQSHFEKPIITQVLPFKKFKENDEHFKDYYKKNPNSQFCQNYINPKLDLLKQKFSKHLN
ncbi:MAG: peptide methionine sulfoxide reductase [Saprospiraceae bacterium]|nr:peptide-methionine (S)-S-oxide reductase [Bacteroidia bacterium]NNE14617.1 peptide methionine sulfoxide reductase [Saprospiraceae bacterium]NNL92520.1 peptide methionine sulfoxide reductase [Saprospiraceae bacterium]